MEIPGTYLVILPAIIFPLTLLSTYSLAVTCGHVVPFVPFMSYTGDLPYESCIFSFGLNLVAGFYALLVVIRYHLIQLYYDDEDTSDSFFSLCHLNNSSLYWGITSAMGLSVTGSFQEMHAPIIHPLGALLCSYCAFVYLWHQTIVSHILQGKLVDVSTVQLRKVIVVTSTLFHFVAPILVTFLDSMYPREHSRALIWTPAEEGWRLHASCSSLEWSVFLLNETFVASYYWEFRKVALKSDEIIVSKNEIYQSINETSGSSTEKQPVVTFD